MKIYKRRHNLINSSWFLPVSRFKNNLLVFPRLEKFNFALKIFNDIFCSSSLEIDKVRNLQNMGHVSSKSCPHFLAITRPETNSSLIPFQKLKGAMIRVSLKKILIALRQSYSMNDKLVSIKRSLTSFFVHKLVKLMVVLNLIFGTGYERI